MIPEFGHFALICALLAAIVQATLPMAGAALGHSRLMSLARELNKRLEPLMSAPLSRRAIGSDVPLDD